jgi:uncharacterized protein
MADPKNVTTPGVYVSELPAFPTSIVGVQTAIPIFIGYTEFAKDPVSGAALAMTAVPIASMTDYARYFGAGYAAKYAVVPATADAYDFEAADASGALGTYSVANSESAQFNLFMALELFYANGGGACYVVSVGGYTKIARQDLLNGLAVAGEVKGPTMLVVPDACLLTEPGDYSAVTTAQLNRCGALQDRLAILDLPGALDPAGWTVDGLGALRDAFYTAIAPAAVNFSYGTAYAPALRVSVLGANDVDYGNLQATQAASDLLKSLLAAQNEAIYGATTSRGRQVQAKLDLAFPADLSKSTVAPADISALNQFLANTLPLYATVEAILLTKLNVASPSGAMAGIWTANDANRGVWNAPANVSLSSVIAPEVLLNNEQQAGYNVPLNGNAINILRSFVLRGTVVWGARTLDGNSNDYRYIQIRRTLVYIEQSIKTALGQFVFAPNVGQTWTTVTSLISNFLTTVWSQGGLMGATASEAYTVQCGLGSTMTAQDILDGHMIASVTLQMIHPAEFIELTFTQQMQGG